MPTKPLILKRRQLAKTRLFQIEEQDLQFANGARRVYERLLRFGEGAVLIVPMLDDETVLLVREYGAGIGDYQIALPKGAIDPGEEVGYGARELQLIKSLTLSPAYMEHDILVVLAEGLYESRLPGDEPETIEVIPWKLDDLAALVSRDDFTEGRSIAALFLVRDLLNNRAAIKL